MVKAGQCFVKHSDVCTNKPIPYRFSTNRVIFPHAGIPLYGEPMVYSNIYQLMNINISSKKMMSIKIPLCWEGNSWLAFHILLQEKIYLDSLFSPGSFHKEKKRLHTFFSPCHFHKEKINGLNNFFFSFGTFTRRKNNC